LPLITSNGSSEKQSLGIEPRLAVSILKKRNKLPSNGPCTGLRQKTIKKDFNYVDTLTGTKH